MLSVLRNSRNLRGLTCGRIAILREINTELDLREASLSDNEPQRKYVKPLKSRELKPFTPNFFIDLYAGNFDKKFFEYPVVIDEKERDLVMKHGLEIEEYVRNRRKNKNSNQITKDVLEDLKKLDLFGLCVPQQYGGCGYTQTELKFLIECASSDFEIAQVISSSQDLGALLINSYGSEEQKQKYLPKIASGENIATLAFLEDNPLVDFTNFQTISTELPDRGGFLISGKKKWVHNADISDLIIVLAKGVKIDYNDKTTSVLFNLFICDRKTPGLSIHQLKSVRGKQLNLYEVDFENVFVKKEDYIEGDTEAPNLLLSTPLSMSQISSAAICLALIKRIIYEAAQHAEEKIFDQKPLMEKESVKSSIGILATCAYALESVIYMVAGRFDIHEEPDLYLESCIGKILASDMLHLAIDKYLQILSWDSYRFPGILDEALKVLQYNTVFDENNLYLKLMMSSMGIIHGAKPKAEFVKKIRQRTQYPWDFMKYLARMGTRELEDFKSKHKLKMELHGNLRTAADALELCLSKLESCVQAHLIECGNLAVQDEDKMAKIAEGAVYTYALACCLGRASSSYCSYGQDSENELLLAHYFTSIARSKLDLLWSELSSYSDFSHFYKEVGKITFFNKEYPAAHPIARTD